MSIKNKYSKILIVTMILCQLIFASYDMRIHKTDDSVARIEVSDIVDMTFQDGTSGKEIVIKRTSASDYVCATTDIDSITFQETGTVTDLDKNTYKTIKIGDQWWMAENLKVTQYNDKTAIPNITDNDTWEGLSSGAYCAYEDNGSNVATYGYLYNWYAVETGELAPTGWHVPTDEEWKELEMALGMSQSEADNSGERGTNEGSKLAGRADLWYDGDLENDSEFGSSGFAGLPAGYRDGSGAFYLITAVAYFWSASEEFLTDYAWYRGLYCSNSDVYRSNYNSKQYGFSVRCVRD